jgi:heme exporter protein CcmB
VAAVWDFDQLIFDGVTADYGRRRVLSRVAFRCQRGSITGIVGPNGAGKTTLLTIASTRSRPSAGRVCFVESPSPGLPGRRSPGGAEASEGPGEGVVGHGDARVRARIGWLGHDPGLYPELSARENLTFFAALHRLDRRTERVAAALRTAGLEHRGDDMVGGFSRGMRQRVGLERVLLHEPTLVVLDEPFTGLDDVSSRALLARLEGLKRRGCIVLLSTHDLDLAAPLLDRAIVLREGRVIAELSATADLSAAVRQALEQAAAASASSAPGERGSTHSGSTPTHGLTASAKATAVRRSVSRRRKPVGYTSAPVGDTSTERPEPDRAWPALRAFLGATATIARKDLVVEFRSRELFLTTLFFALSTVLVFAFAFVREGRPLGDAAAGILWVATAFAGTLALGRTFDREQAHQTLPALLQAPIDRAAVYAGKLVGLLGLSWLVLLAIVPLVGLLFQASVAQQALPLAVLLVAGSIGFLAVGSLFAAMLVRTRSRDVLLPVLLFPMTVPVLLAGVRGTGALLQETPDFALWRLWLTMLLFFDAVFVTLALWTFDAVTSD